MTGIKVFKEIHRRQGLIIVLVLFAVSILLRLPNLNRPLSKHHEYNTAVILVDIESWRQAGGGSQFHYTPLLNYQNPGDKCPQRLPQIDSSGNILYLSFGPGWYVFPYFVFQLFHLPVVPVYLQVINLVFNLAAVILLFLLCDQLIPDTQPRKYYRVILTCVLFMYSPGILWFLGNGYVTTGIMMPIVMAALLVLIPMLQSAEKIRAPRLVLLGLLIILLAYIDWFILFIAAVSSVWLLFKIRKDKRYALLLIVMAIACISGIALIFLQFASYAGRENVIFCWLNRFKDRSIPDRGWPFFAMAGYVCQHIVTSYLPVLLVLFFAATGLRLKKIKINHSGSESLFQGIYAISILLYNFILLQWSSDHEFALIPLSILLAFSGAGLTMRLVNIRGFYIVTASFLILACAQYYLINRPGKVSWNGDHFDVYQQLGQELKTTPPDYKLFMNHHWTAVIDFYAKRNITPVDNIDSARAYMKRWGISKAVWIEQTNYRLKEMVILR